MRWLGEFLDALLGRADPSPPPIPRERRTVPGADGMPFGVGDTVEKVGGDTKFWGEVRALYELRPGVWRADVMAVHPEFENLTHIYAPHQLRLRLLTVPRKV